MLIDHNAVLTLRMGRQFLFKKASRDDYAGLYRDLQPGQSVYWNGFGDPPSLTYRASFDDMEFNRKRQLNRELIKGRFSGGNLGWIVPEDLELFAAAFCKPLKKPTIKQLTLLELIENAGPLTIQQIKEETGMLVKEITPVLHRLQQAFLIYEDQNDGEWDRGWYRFGEMFPDLNLKKYTRHSALKAIIQRFAYRLVRFDLLMAKSFYRLPLKDLKAAVTDLVVEGILLEVEGGFCLATDLDYLQKPVGKPALSPLAMHRNDILVKSNEHWLKERFTHGYPDTLYYLLINGEFRGAVPGKFRYTPDVEDVILDLSGDEARSLKAEILDAIHVLCGEDNPIRRYQGEAQV